MVKHRLLNEEAQGETPLPFFAHQGDIQLNNLRTLEPHPGLFFFAFCCINEPDQPILSMYPATPMT
jgi:hypothetical protein